MKKIVFSILVISSSVVFGQMPSLQWAKKIMGSFGTSITTDALGNVYTVGRFGGTVDFNPGAAIYNLTADSTNTFDVFISKLDISGNFVWAKKVGGNQDDFGNSVAVDNSGNIYVTGYFKETADFDPGAGTYNLTSFGDEDIFVLKLDSIGNFIWAKDMGGSAKEYATSIAVDGAGNVFTTGEYEGAADFDPNSGTFVLTTGGGDTFISELDIDGNFVWAEGLRGSGGYSFGNAIKLDASGSIYVTGYFGGTVDFNPGSATYNMTAIGSQDAYIVKLDLSGNFVWSKHVGGSFSSSNGLSITVDGLGNVYASGDYIGGVDFDPGAGTYTVYSDGSNGDIFVLKLSALGNFAWVKSITEPYDDEGVSIALDASDNVYTTGYFYNSIDIDTGPGVSTLTSAGGPDVFVLKLDTSGNFAWGEDIVATYPSASSSVESIAVDASGNIYTTGFYWRQVDFDPSSGVDSAGTGATGGCFIHKMSQGPAGIAENTNSNSISLYPNPASNVINLETEIKNATLSVFDAQGKLMHEEKMQGNKMQLDVSGFSSGLYFMEVQSGDKMVSRKFIKQ